jgi:uncharacterized protein (TIGR00369 family)
MMKMQSQACLFHAIGAEFNVCKRRRTLASSLAHAQQVLASQPFSALLGAELAVYSEDRVEIRLAIVDRLKQQHGFVHGGVLSYLADNALTFAGGLRLTGQIVTAEYKINYLRPALGTELIARGQVLSAGSSQAVTRCEIYVVLDGTERLCAAAQGTIMVRRSQQAPAATSTAPAGRQ